MPFAPEEQLEILLHASIETKNATKSKEEFRVWFFSQFEQQRNAENGGCSLETFANYFLSAVRHHTEIHMRCIESESVKCQSSAGIGKSTTDAAGCDVANSSTPKRIPLATQNSAPSTPTYASTPELHGKGKESIGGDHIHWDDSIFHQSAVTNSPSSLLSVTPNQSIERSVSRSLHNESSTHIRHTRSGANNNNGRRSANSFHIATSNNNPEKQARSNNSASSFCLGDFIVLQPGNNRSNRKKQPQSHGQQATTAENTPTMKPKKRVVPITISNRANVTESSELKPFGGSSSFSNENNILRISNVEIEDKDKCSIMAARRSLKLNAGEISKELKTTERSEEETNVRGIIDRKMSSVPQAVSSEEIAATNIVAQVPPVNFELVDNRDTLQTLAAIYNVLLDLNYVTNILSELAFLLNLLNAHQQPSPPQSLSSITDQMQSVHLETCKSSTAVVPAEQGINLLKNVTNCIYFALRVLQEQMNLLALLDSKSLRVVLYNERIWSLDCELKSNMESIYQRKQLLEADKCHATDIALHFEKSFRSVYYREDKDSRQHFTSNHEFGAFKTQRDLFYKTLKLWETQHLNPSWNFTQELTPKIREIFKQSENPVNMAHFAKLFVSQLLISASDATSPEEMGLEMDAQKFSKLTQRLVAPSNFSVDYQFPRNQAFFRDFIWEARSIPFNEQLKMALYSQLITLNDSTFEQLNVEVVNDGDTDELEVNAAQSEHNEFVVRPEVLASMIILAKFLGFTTAQPYKQHNHTSFPPSIEKKQVMLRSLFQPHFNVCRHLQEAIRNNKMIITLPWLVQYLAMLDNVTLQLENCVETTQLMFVLYMRLGVGAGLSTLSPTSIFILRCCLGWLFETKPLIADQFCSYRAAHFETLTPLSGVAKNDVQEMQVLIPKEFLNALPNNAAFCSMGGMNTPNTDVLKEDKAEVGVSEDVILSESRSKDNYLEQSLNPMLESLLPVACPFLAEFRVSIMPTKHATMKYVSRTGRYRHITTRIAESHTVTTNSATRNNFISTTLDVQQSQQNKLIDAFLHSQNASMRRLIEFVTDRTFKSVVKDAQNRYVLPLKVAADKEVNKITSCAEEEVSKDVSSIYERALNAAQEQWQINVPRMLEERVAKALAALLPVETAPIIRQTYFILIHRNATQRVQQWYHANLVRSNYYCGDVNEITQKICKANEKSQHTTSVSELKIIKLVPSVSDMIDEMQYWLHCTSLRIELLTTAEEILTFLQRLPAVFENTLPTIFYRLTGAGIVQLLQHIIVRKPEYLTTELITAACKVWTHHEMQNAIKMSKSKPSANEVNTDCEEEVSNSSSNDTESSTISSIYDGLISVTFIESMGTSRIRYDKLYNLLTTMIKQRALSVNRVNVLFVSIFKENWPVSVLNEISRTLQNIVASTTMAPVGKRDHDSEDSDDEAKSHLFMGVLADFSRDVDDF